MSKQHKAKKSIGEIIQEGVEKHDLDEDVVIADIIQMTAIIGCQLLEDGGKDSDSYVFNNGDGQPVVRMTFEKLED